MTDPFGLGETVPDPAPKPSAPKASRKPKPTPEPTGPTPDPRDLAAAQRRRLEARADELAEIHKQLVSAGELAGPVDRSAAETPIQHVIREWRSALSSPAGLASLGLPAGTRGNVVPWPSGGEPTGVSVGIRLPAGAPLPAAMARATAALTARNWGEWVPEPIDVDDRGHAFTLTREHVGGDPLTPWRAAGKTALAVHLNQPPHVRRLLFENAGLAVKKANGTVDVARVKETSIGERGPEILIDLPAISTDAALKTEPMLRRLLRSPDLTVSPEGVRVRIALNTRPLPTFPKLALLEPTDLHRPTNQLQRYLAAPKLTLPVGINRSGESVMLPLASRPHSVVAGTSGAGKSRTLLSAISGLCLQGASVALCDFKGDPDWASLAGSGLPGIVHYSTTLGGISRLVLWLFDEMEMRSNMLPLMRQRGIDRPVFAPVVAIIDEWGQGLDELLESRDPAERGAGQAMVTMVSKLFAQGRSFGIYIVLSTQHTYVSALPGRIVQNAANRIVIGKPKSGAAGPISVLFKDEKEEAELAASGIVDGQRGRLILGDQAGKIQQVQAFYGYTPAEAPESASDAALAANWARMKKALEATPKLRRFAWEFPDDGTGEWQKWSLFAGDKSTGELTTVRELPMIFLDDFEGKPDPRAARFDPMSSEYSPGAPLLNPHHISPSNRL